jgi:hypothetical protein
LIILKKANNSSEETVFLAGTVEIGLGKAELG